MGDSKSFALDLYNYQTLALILGGLGVVGTIIWVVLVTDPFKIQKEPQTKTLIK